LVLLASSAMVLAACGGGDEDNNSGSSNQPTSESTGGATSEGAALPKLDGQSLEVAAVWSGAEQKSFEAVLKSFEDKTGATVKFTSTGDDIATVLGTRLEGGQPPDVAVLPQPGLLAQFAKRGALQPLGPDIESEIDKNYESVWKELGTVDGKLYGAWFKGANKSTVWYRPDVFEQAGVEPPQDWNEFLQAAQTIADSGVTPVAIGGGDGWTLTDWFENVYLRVAGPEKYDQLTKHEIPWTDPTVVKTLQHLAELWGKQDLIVGGSKGALQTAFPQSVTEVFGQKKGAMVYEGDFVAGVISSETKAKVGTDAQFFDFPAVDGSEPSIVGGGDVAVQMKDSEGAKALVQYLATPEAAEIWVKQGGFISPNKNVDLAAYPDDVTRAIAEALVQAKIFRFDLSDQTPSQFGGTPSQGMWKALQDFLRDPSNPQATAKTLEQLAAKAYGH
jgi:ABC-type glycerol-3-phosphate transport system substrate-binding protein